MHTLNQLLDNFVKNEIISGITCEGCNKNRPPHTDPVTASAIKLLRFGKVGIRSVVDRGQGGRESVYNFLI